MSSSDASLIAALRAEAANKGALVQAQLESILASGIVLRWTPEGSHWASGVAWIRQNSSSKLTELSHEYGHFVYRDHRWAEIQSELAKANPSQDKVTDIKLEREAYAIAISYFTGIGNYPGYLRTDQVAAIYLATATSMSSMQNVTYQQFMSMLSANIKSALRNDSNAYPAIWRSALETIRSKNATDRLYEGHDHGGSSGGESGGGDNGEGDPTAPDPSDPGYEPPDYGDPGSGDPGSGEGTGEGGGEGGDSGGGGPPGGGWTDPGDDPDQGTGSDGDGGPPGGGWTDPGGDGGEGGDSGGGGGFGNDDGATDPEQTSSTATLVSAPGSLSDLLVDRGEVVAEYEHLVPLDVDGVVEQRMADLLVDSIGSFGAAEGVGGSNLSTNKHDMLVPLSTSGPLS